MTKGEITTASSSKNISMTSPYFLSHSNNPGVSITPVTLTGENYAEWASKLENALRAKRKIGFINRTLLMPDENEKPAEAELWKTVNSMIVGWIRTSISATVRSTVTFTPDAFKMWSDLKRRFSIGNAVRVHQLKAELAACKQDGLTVLDYFGRLSSKWEELLSCKPIPKCTYDAADVYVKEYEEDKVHQFLMGLDEERFSNVCTNIIGLEVLLDLNSAYQRVVREEKRLGDHALKLRRHWWASSRRQCREKEKKVWPDVVTLSYVVTVVVLDMRRSVGKLLAFRSGLLRGIRQMEEVEEAEEEEELTRREPMQCKHRVRFRLEIKDHRCRS